MGNVFSIQLSCDTIITGCWDCVSGPAIRAYQLQVNLAALKISSDELKEQRHDVMTKVNLAEERSLKPLKEVKGWLTRTETRLDEVDQLLIDGTEQVEKLCMGGYCSKGFMSTLRFSKMVAKRLDDVKDLKSKGEFKDVATEVPSAAVMERPINDEAIGLESMLSKVWRCIFDEDEGKNVGIIGIYGIGGVGKTRLLTEINNKINNGFDMVIWVVVSKGFSTGKIQDDIAKRIGLSRGILSMWDEKTDHEEKALDIFRTLKEKKFLLLLDDVWERIDLLKVGIPLPSRENGSKLIFTTRSTEVCGQMRAQKKIEMQCLPREKAWELFEEYVGSDALDSHPDIRDRHLAQELAKECGGLPLALITIGRAMACKNTPEEWEYAIEVLKRSANSVFPNMGEEVYPLLKFSYDCLPNDITRCCLLYCTLFTEDCHIPKEILVDAWIVEGFTDEYESIRQARKQGHEIIGSLVRACLLEEVSDGTVKMHDVIRDMSLWIACTLDARKWEFFVRAGYRLTEMPEVGKWKGVRRMSLMQNQIENLIDTPNCPDLQTLLLSQNELKVIHNDFFQFMSGLKVLCFRVNKGLRELPVGISKLVSLECLDISFTGIRQLPIELKGLRKLKCLNMEYLPDGITVPKGLISGFPKLRMLRMIGSFPFVEDCSSTECLANELQCLKQLNVLSMSVASAYDLDRILSAESLCSRVEQIGLHSFKDSKQLNIFALANLRNLNYVLLSKCESLEEVKIQISGIITTQTWFQSLVKVYVSGCSKLRDITWLILAQYLRHFIVIDCSRMEEIINETKLNQVADLVGILTPFAKLKSLYLGYLPELKSIYQDALPFSCMKDIHVYACPKLRRLPLNSYVSKRNGISIHGKEKWWNELQWEDESTRNAFLPCFVAD